LTIFGHTERRHGAHNAVEAVDGGQRKLESDLCSAFAAGKYFDGVAGECFNLGGLAIDDKIEYIRSTENTCIEIFENGDGGGLSLSHCGDEWIQVDEALSDKVSRVCCVVAESSDNLATEAPGWH
jgi:hypothetical protein